jgi:hypothetical protein
MDEALTTPAIDLSAATSASLTFDHWFRQYQNEIADVDVRSGATGGVWTNLRRWSGASSSNPEHVVLDLTAHAGRSDVQLRWRYYDADFEWTWFVDNVAVDFIAPGGCQSHPCLGAPAGPPPVPSLHADRALPDGSRIVVDWDDTCGPERAKILYGPLDQVGTYAVSGAVCAVADPATWDGVPAGNLWFLVVPDRADGTEGSWGEATAGERNGSTASGYCGSAVKELTGTCP